MTPVPREPIREYPQASGEQVYGSRIRPPTMMRWVLETGARIHRLDAAKLVRREAAPHGRQDHECDKTRGPAEHHKRVPDVPRLGGLRGRRPNEYHAAAHPDHADQPPDHRATGV